MNLEGELVVRVAWNEGIVRGVSIRSTRPLAVAAVLEGRAVDDAAAIVPRLYSVCASAQRAAAVGALGAAEGGAPRLTDRNARATVAEAIQEQLRRLLIDLPSLQGHAPAVAPVAAARRAISPLLGVAGHASASVHVYVADELHALCTTHVFGVAPEAWLEQAGVDELRAWADAGSTLPARIVAQWLQADPALGASDVKALPAADRESIEAQILAPLAARPSFARAPTWNGEPRETGPCARNGSHPLVAACRGAFGNSAVTRTVARLVDVARDVLRLRGACADVFDAWSPACDEGVAIVQTARGMLVHAAKVKAGRVERYAIVAPTEWNFHPDGALTRGIAALADGDGDSLARRAETVVQTLDPCVAYRVEIGHA